MATRVGFKPVTLRTQGSNLPLSHNDVCALIVNLLQVGRTETVKNCLDPQFAKSIEVDYFFEEVQQLKFSINDVDGAGKDSLGFLSCTLGEVSVCRRCLRFFATFRV